MWCSQYKNAPAGSLEQRIYQAACYVICFQGEEKQHEEICRAIGREAFESGACIWHAAWVVDGRKGKCHCSPCTTARGEKVIRL